MSHFSLLRSVILSVLLLSCAGQTRLDYDAIGLHETIVRGGQREIDQGHVVDVNGLPGIWLAGHHTTHGAVFADLGDFNVGDRVCAYEKCYTIFNSIIVPQDYQVTQELAPLVLQTSWYGRVLLVLAE